MSEEKKITVYNKEKEFMDAVGDHMLEVIKYCKINKIPFFSSFAVSNTEERTKYKNYVITPGLEDVNLTNNMINKHVLIYRNFDISPIGAIPSTRDDDLDAYINDDDFEIN